MRKLGVYSERALRAAGEMGGPEGLWAGEGEARGWPTRPRVGVAWPRPSVLPVLPPPPGCTQLPALVPGLARHCLPVSLPARSAAGTGRVRSGRREAPSLDVPHPRLQGGAELSRVVLEARASPRFWGRGGEGADASWPRPGASGLRGGETLPQARVRSACGTHSRLRPGRRPFPLQRFSSSFPKLRATGPTTSAGC